MTLIIKEIERQSTKIVKTWELSDITSMSRCLDIIRDIDKALSKEFHTFTYTIVE